MKLSEVEPGARAQVVGFNGMSASQREGLHAYGMDLGIRVRVLQHSPVTVIEVENTELALETQIARQIEVELLAAPGHRRKHRRRRSQLRNWRRRFSDRLE